MRSSSSNLFASSTDSSMSMSTSSGGSGGSNGEFIRELSWPTPTDVRPLRLLWRQHHCIGRPCCSMTIALLGCLSGESWKWQAYKREQEVGQSESVGRRRGLYILCMCFGCRWCQVGTSTIGGMRRLLHQWKKTASCSRHTLIVHR